MKLLGVEEFTEGSKIWRSLAAEFLGTAFLLFFGCGSAIGTINIVRIALCFGLCIGVIVQSIGHVSGGHINPAVTLSFLVVGKCSILKSICYIVLQMAGATTGYFLLSLLTWPPDSVRPVELYPGTSAIASGLTPVQGMVIETIATFLFCFVIHAVCDERRSDVKMIAPLLIGLAAVVCHLFAGPISGSSINPARTFGPSVVSGMWKNHWIYWVGPILGGCIGSIFYKLVLQVRKGEEETSSYDFA